MSRHVIRLQSVVENLVQSAVLTRLYLQIEKPYYQKDCNIFYVPYLVYLVNNWFDLCIICIVSAIMTEIGIIH